MRKIFLLLSDKNPFCADGQSVGGIASPVPPLVASLVKRTLGMLVVMYIGTCFNSSVPNCDLNDKNAIYVVKQ